MMYMLTKNAIDYTVRFLMSVAAPGWNNFSVTIADDFDHAVVWLDRDTSVRFNIQTGEQDYRALLDGKAPFIKLPSLTGSGEIPLFFADSNEFYSLSDKMVHIQGDIITASFIMLSRCEELSADEEAGFLFEESIACKYDFIDYPLVDEYALYIRKTLRKLLPDAEIVTGKFTIIPTHDVDDVQRFYPLKRLFTSIASDLIKTKSIKVAVVSFFQFIKSLYTDDPNIAGIKKYCDISKELGYTSEFYFMSAVSKGFDRGYEYTPKVEQAIAYIKSKGMLIGFHPGYYAGRDKRLFSEERKRIEPLIGTQPLYGRHHYLRFKADLTFDMWEENGLRADSTLGYNDREGFRCGTCHEYTPYDFGRDKQYDRIVERPLIVMDCTLYSYRELDVAESYKKTKVLVERCQKAEGNFIINWHNTSWTRGREPWFEGVYCRILREYAIKQRDKKEGERK